MRFSKSRKSCYTRCKKSRTMRYSEEVEKCMLKEELKPVEPVIPVVEKPVVEEPASVVEEPVPEPMVEEPVIIPEPTI